MFKKGSLETLKDFLKDPASAKPEPNAKNAPVKDFKDSETVTGEVDEAFDALGASLSFPQRNKQTLDMVLNYAKYLSSGGRGTLRSELTKQEGEEADKLGLKGSEKRKYIEDKIQIDIKRLETLPRLKGAGASMHKNSINLVKQNEFYVDYLLRREADNKKLKGDERKEFIKRGMEQFKATHVRPETKLLKMADSDLTVAEKQILDNAAYVYDALTNEVKDNTGNRAISIEGFKRMISMRPQLFGSKGILSQNAKMEKTKFMNFSIPALRALVVDEDTNELIIINTCPGAGSCQIDCYALKNRYVASMEPGMRQARTLNYMLNDIEGFLRDVNKQIEKAYNRYSKKGAQLIIRWHDAGDFFSTRYYDIFIERIVKKHPNVEFYIYTKIGDIANSTDHPKNFTINFSLGAKPDELRKVDLSKVKYSVITRPDVSKESQPKKVVMDFFKKFYDIRVKDENAEEGAAKYDKWDFYSPKHEKEFKEWIAKTWNRDPKKILTYEEFESMPVGKPLEYDVIVTPKNGDLPATRKDVHVSFLLWH